MFKLSINQIAIIAVLGFVTNIHIGSYNKPQQSLAMQVSNTRVAEEGDNKGKHILFTIPDANPMSWEKFVAKCDEIGGFGAWNKNSGESEKTCFAKPN